MKRFESTKFASVFQRTWPLVLAALIVPQAVRADSWHATVGAQSDDQGRQVLAFLPNEMWIHAGDSITWNFAADEIHTVSFLRPGQIRPTREAGCPGTTADGSVFTGAACVNSGIATTGSSYTINFPSAGNFKLVCLVHANMTGTVHVLDPAEPLPHDQAFYDRQAETEARELLADGSRLAARGILAAHHSSDGEDNDDQENATNDVTLGMSEVVATTGGGSQSVGVMRFLEDEIVVHVGDTVDWTSFGPVVQHTVTFGTEPADPIPPSSGVTIDPDGARHAFIGSPTDSLNSGALLPERQDRAGLPQVPLAVTHFRVTFTQAGVYNYKCALHDQLGMVGRVIVLP